MTMINIKGLSKASVLAALHNAATPAGMGWLHAKQRDMTEEEAAAYLTRSCYVDYCAGRPIKVNLEGDEFDPWLYDRDAGTGTAELAIARLRAEVTA
jgi:hypothetical protein